MCEKFLSEFGAKPIQGSGNLGGKRTHGSYTRVRNRLIEFLASEMLDDARSIRVRSDPRNATDSDFFPSAIEAAIGVVNGGQKIGSFGVAEKEVDNIYSLADRAASTIFSTLGPSYGGVWDFPAEYGAEPYVAAVNTVPGGVRLDSNKKYAGRLVNWTNNVWKKKLRTRQGYFREVYPINYLVDAHLRMEFRGSALYRFLEAEGTLHPCEFNEQMYRWDVPDENLAIVRLALEPSGLILSSDAAPIQVA